MTNPLTAEELAKQLRREADSWIKEELSVSVSDTLEYLAADLITAQAAEIERLKVANSVRPDYPLFCGDCGRAHILDTVLPSEIWNQIATPSDLLCAVCIDRRLSETGLKAEAQFFYSGDALTSEIYAEHLAAEIERLTEEVRDLKIEIEETVRADNEMIAYNVSQAKAAKTKVAAMEKALKGVRMELWVDYCLHMGRTDCDPRPFDIRPHIRIIDAALGAKP